MAASTLRRIGENGVEDMLCRPVSKEWAPVCTIGRARLDRLAEPINHSVRSVPLIRSGECISRLSAMYLFVTRAL
ncbi:hypothetical protein PSAB6_220147 [Paraburkholderia sabiae]|nr:hypothetical protein PSAB6_220147 [Paraburkholderia sabiae]